MTAPIPAPPAPSLPPLSASSVPSPEPEAEVASLPSSPQTFTESGIW